MISNGVTIILFISEYNNNENLPTADDLVIEPIICDSNIECGLSIKTKDHNNTLKFHIICKCFNFISPTNAYIKITKYVRQILFNLYGYKLPYITF